MKHLALLLLVPILLTAQVKEKLVATPNAAAMANYEYISVNANGQYCIETKIDGHYYFYTESQTLGPFNYIGSTYGRTGEIRYTYSAADSLAPWYYKNYYGTNVYGPVNGRLARYEVDKSNNAAVVAVKNDSAFYYVNGRLVHGFAATAQEIKSLNYPGHDWCAFSPNGNCLYTFTDRGMNYLYKNGKLIHSSKDDFDGLHINNNGTYVYATGHKPEQKVGKYDYMFTIHSGKTTLSPVRTIWENTLKPNGGYYYSGDDNGPEYIAINNNLFKDIEKITQVNLPDKKHFAFSFSQNGQPFVNGNGKIINADGANVQLLNMDNKGNYAFVALKNYYYYKYINGKKQAQPLTRFGVRPQVLYISPKGEAMLYYKTQDSVYVYRDDKPLIAQAKENVVMRNAEDFFNYATNQTSRGYTAPFYYISTTGRHYILYKEKLWEPAVDLSKEGTIATSLITDEGFFLIYKLGENRYSINVNNTNFAEFTGPEKILSKNAILDDNNLVFFGIKNNSIYQYTFKL